MNRTVLRILQIGLVLIILAGFALAGATVLGVMHRAAALAAARDVGLLIALAVGAACALVAVIGLGRDGSGSGDR